MTRLLNFMLIAGLMAVIPFESKAQTEIPEGGKLEFKILRNGDPFGMHVIEFKQKGGKIITDIEINMKVSLAFFTLFEYEHHNREVWQGGRLISMESKTNDDGKKYFVKAKRQGDKILVKSTKGTYETPGDIAASTYWREDMIKRDQILNSQKGRLQDISIENLGVEQVIAGEEYVPATHYKVQTKDRVIDVWYHTKSGQWVDLAFKIKGQSIDYVRLTPIQVTH